MSSSLFNSAEFQAALFGGAAGADGSRVVEVGQGILYPALRKAGITLGPQRIPSVAQFQDAIDELNRLAGMLSCDRLFIYSIGRAEFPLTAGKASYTIGISDSVDFAAERLQLIESANIIHGSDVGRPLGVITDPEWARISANLSAGGPAGGIYNDRGYPVSTLYVTGPTQPGESLELFTWQRVPQFLAVTDQVLLPIQYEDCLVLNLACRLAPHFQRQLDPLVMQQAQESLMHLRSINAPQPIADTSGALTCGCGGYDIYTDS